MAVEPPYRMRNMMPGMIMLWYGSIATIPSGWHLCDGTMGTPNLIDRFVACAGSEWAPGEVGGSYDHSHEWSTGYFFLDFLAGTGVGAGTDFEPHTDFHIITHNTEDADTLPPFMALCYIMKLT